MKLGMGGVASPLTWQALVRHLIGTVIGLCASGFLLIQTAHADTPNCQFVIGSCHRPPLSNASGTGIIDRIVIEAFRRLGYVACIEAQTCERSLRNADSGVADGDVLRVPEAVAASAPNLVSVPETLYVLPMSGFTLQPDLRINGLDSLAGLRVGYILGWKILEEKVRAAGTLRVRDTNELFTLLPANKVDLVIYERLTGQQQAKEMGLAGLLTLEPPLLLTPQHLMLNRRHQQLLEPLAAALRAIKADGTYAANFKAAGQPTPETK
jgi:polar amino acid transport system substrate-binding protein